MRARRLSTASRDRRQARSARSRPMRRASRTSGVSISNCTSAVVACVEPRIGPRRSIIATSWPSAVSASAIIAPETPIPTTSTPARASRRSGATGTRGAR